ncbi:uncharacterized protein LOC108909498 [Anoplophora glabripennis]|uniref:uncharacterized protein LOC108909498 n=1 Tax=Anoplophora glabripennis TaxID=217634 RepID=UPI0008755475|nr:uncharacterized protein LOC108909498 [Anoplophora glabripennis]
MIVYWKSLLLFVITLIKLGNTLECYHCHQTSPECVNGVKRSLQTSNCTETKCFVLKYETDMPGVTVLATYRGCYNMNLTEMIKFVTTEGHKVRKTHFHLCNYTLCNSATSNMINFSYFIGFITYFLIS